MSNQLRIKVSRVYYRRANDLDYIKFLTGGNRIFPTKDNTNVPNSILYEKMPLHPNINYIFKSNHDLTFSNMAKNGGSTNYHIPTEPHMLIWITMVTLT